MDTQSVKKEEVLWNQSEPRSKRLRYAPRHDYKRMSGAVTRARRKKRVPQLTLAQIIQADHDYGPWPGEKENTENLVADLPMAELDETENCEVDAPLPTAPNNKDTPLPVRVPIGPKGKDAPLAVPTALKEKDTSVPIPTTKNASLPVPVAPITPTKPVVTTAEMGSQTETPMADMAPTKDKHIFWTRMGAGGLLKLIYVLPEIRKPFPLQDRTQVRLRLQCIEQVAKVMVLGINDAMKPITTEGRAYLKEALEKVVLKLERDVRTEKRKAKTTSSEAVEEQPPSSDHELDVSDLEEEPENGTNDENVDDFGVQPDNGTNGADMNDDNDDQLGPVKNETKAKAPIGKATTSVVEVDSLEEGKPDAKKKAAKFGEEKSPRKRVKQETLTTTGSESFKEGKPDIVKKRSKVVEGKPPPRMEAEKSIPAITAISDSFKELLADIKKGSKIVEEKSPRKQLEGKTTLANGASSMDGEVDTKITKKKRITFVGEIPPEKQREHGLLENPTISEGKLAEAKRERRELRKAKSAFATWHWHKRRPGYERAPPRGACKPWCIYRDMPGINLYKCGSTKCNHWEHSECSGLLRKQAEHSSVGKCMRCQVYDAESITQQFNRSIDHLDELVHKADRSKTNRTIKKEKVDPFFATDFFF